MILYSYTLGMKWCRFFFSFVVITLFIWWFVSADYSFDVDKIQQTRLQWTNEERSSVWVSQYTIDDTLIQTATQRSEYSKWKNNITHERKKGDGYYNYKSVEKWFANRDVYFQNIKKATFSESIWYGYVSCPRNGDCTDALIQATRSTWKFFMSEKYKKSQPHYKAIVHKNFSIMWVWVVIDPATKKYYLTVHYGTKVIKK